MQVSSIGKQGAPGLQGPKGNLVVNIIWHLALYHKALQQIAHMSLYLE